MKCRALVQSNNRQNIVWFGSYGINKNYIKKTFVEPPLEYKWQEEYKRYYVIAFMRSNESPVWGESSLFCSDDLMVYQMTYAQNTYYENINNSYYLLTSSSTPLDWESNPSKYYQITMTALSEQIPWTANKYYKLEGSDYILLSEYPNDWNTNYANYYEITFKKCIALILMGDEKPSYFRKEGNTYVAILTKPDDWSDNWDKYYIGDFVENDNPVFDPTIEYYAHNNKLVAENYSEEQKAIRDSLIQRLSIIKGELWYKASYGLPLMEKIKSKGIYDTVVINIITSTPGVVNIVSFVSNIEKVPFDNSTKTITAYVLDFTVVTSYSEEVRIQYTI